MFLYKRLWEASLKGQEVGMAREVVSASTLYHPEEVSVMHAKGGEPLAYLLREVPLAFVVKPVWWC